MHCITGMSKKISYKEEDEEEERVKRNTQELKKKVRERKSLLSWQQNCLEMKPECWNKNCCMLKIT